MNTEKFALLITIIFLKITIIISTDIIIILYICKAPLYYFYVMKSYKESKIRVRFNELIEIYKNVTMKTKVREVWLKVHGQGLGSESRVADAKEHDDLHHLGKGKVEQGF